MQHRFSITVETRARKIKDLAAIGVTANNRVEKKLIGFHHERNLNVVTLR